MSLNQEESKLDIWRKALYKKHKSCYVCNREKMRKYAHHILPKYLYPDLALDVENGVVLCGQCHHEYHHKTPLVEINKQSLDAFRNVVARRILSIALPINFVKEKGNKVYVGPKLKVDKIKKLKPITKKQKKKFKKERAIIHRKYVAYLNSRDKPQETPKELIDAFMKEQREKNEQNRKDI